MLVCIMGAFKHMFTCGVLCVLFAQVQAKPNCKTLGFLQKDVVCTAGSEDYTLQRGLVSDNYRTTRLILRASRIKEIKQESFENLSSLQHLDLSINNLQELSLGVLDGLHQLTYLNLSNNMITRLELGIFDQNSNLEMLDLRNNRFKTFELGVFDPISKLNHLDLSLNLLQGSDLNTYIFDKNKLVKSLDFSRNMMSGTNENILHAFETLDLLNLSGCYLKRDIPIFLRKSNLRTVRHIILSTNEITHINDATTFVNLDSLEILDLSLNAIEVINADAFKPLRKLKKITLRSNILVTIPDNVFQNIPKLGIVDLSYNKLEYIPVDAFRGTVLKILNVSHNKLTYLDDNFALELRNSGAKLTKFFFNDNPWQCACLKGLLNELRSYKVQYNSYKYNGKVPVCTIKRTNANCMRHVSEKEYFINMYNDALETYEFAKGK